ncbi:TPA: HGGxSTG domain-containing protein [Bacillus cereus]
MTKYDGGSLGKKTDAEKRLISKIRKDPKATATEINSMQYDTARKNKVTPHIKNEFKKATIICGAVRKDTGKICPNPPVEGSARCAAHGGYSTGPVSEDGKKRALANLNPQAALVHGLNARFVFTVEEEALYTGLMNYAIEELQLDQMNIILMHRAIMNLIKNERKEVAQAGEILDESDSYQDFDSKFLKYVQALGMDRKFNISNSHKDNQQAMNMNILFDM